jgi:hypothetical protein
MRLHEDRQVIEGVTSSGNLVSLPFNSHIEEVEWDRNSYFEDLNMDNPEWRDNQFERHLYHLMFWTHNGHEWTRDQKKQLEELVEMVRGGE